ncbi:MAG: alpha/beta fold hydrolase [Chitinophagaceae bacterium]|nr:MAG: alpha/beta fold hydrolase [Chitinophagaceae bacterium]
MSDNSATTPLVLLHGFGEDSRVWDRQAPLAEHCRLLTPDLPGSGNTAAPETWSMESLAEAVRDRLDAEGINRCMLVGHSMGGYVALAFAERWPERLLGLGLFHSTSFADTAAKVDTRRKGIDFIRRQGADAFMKTSTPNLYSPATRERRPELIEKSMAEATGMDPDALIGYYEAMIARPDRTHVLKEAEIPVLFILGRHDNAVPLADGLAQCHLPRVSQVHLLEEAGHMGMRECPEQANQHLLTYLRFIHQRRTDR